VAGLFGSSDPIVYILSGGHGAAFDRLHVGRRDAWALDGPHSRPVIGRQGPCEAGQADAVPHTRSPAVGRQVGLGERRGRVSSVNAIAPGW